MIRPLCFFAAVNKSSPTAVARTNANGRCHAPANSLGPRLPMFEWEIASGPRVLCLLSDETFAVLARDTDPTGLRRVLNSDWIENHPRCFKDFDSCPHESRP